LQNANGPWGTKTFYYDGVGNRTSEASTPVGGALTTDTYGYQATSNRLVQITRGAATVRTLAYDNAGSLTSDSGAGGNKTYVYNKRNRLASATIGAIQWSYVYNGLEQLTTRTRVVTCDPTCTFARRSGSQANKPRRQPISLTMSTTSGATSLPRPTAAGRFCLARRHACGAPAAAPYWRHRPTLTCSPPARSREYIYLPEAEIAPTMGARTVVDRPAAHTCGFIPQNGGDWGAAGSDLAG
jgi:YD repeat-containing protein